MPPLDADFDARWAFVGINDLERPATFRAGAVERVERGIELDAKGIHDQPVEPSVAFHSHPTIAGSQNSVVERFLAQVYAAIGDEVAATAAGGEAALLPVDGFPFGLRQAARFDNGWWFRFGGLECWLLDRLIGRGRVVGD